MAAHRWAMGASRWLAAMLLIVALVAAGCGPDPEVLVAGPWKLTSIGGLPPAAEAGISFTAEGRFSIQTGCNSGGGTYRLERDTLTFTEFILTKMACEGPIGVQEGAFLNVLQAGPRIRSLDNRGGRGLVLVAGDATLAFDTP